MIQGGKKFMSEAKERAATYATNVYELYDWLFNIHDFSEAFFADPGDYSENCSSSLKQDSLTRYAQDGEVRLFYNAVAMQHIIPSEGLVKLLLDNLNSDITWQDLLALNNLREYIMQQEETGSVSVLIRNYIWERLPEPDVDAAIPQGPELDYYSDYLEDINLY